MALGGILTIIHVLFAIVIGVYFWNLLRSQQGNRLAIEASRARKWIGCGACGRSA